MSFTQHAPKRPLPSRLPVSFTFCLSVLALTIAVSAVGCGSKTGDQVVDQSGQASPSSATTANVPSPADIVSQYLDLVRRGGADTGAGSLLTTRAQAELKQIGIAVTPIGSPDAKFTVTRSEAFPEQPNSMLVHTIWSEPGSDSATVETEVVWAFERETVGWRISGLAMDQGGPEGPQFIDFENGARMAQLMSEVASEDASKEAIAR